MNELRTWRIASGRTSSEVAAALNVAQAMYSRWENGVRKIPAERVRAISNLTNIPPNVLRPDIFEGVVQ